MERPRTDGPTAYVVTPAQLGAYLDDVRRARGLTQQQLADAAGVPRRFVTELAGGHDTLYARRLFAVVDTLGLRLGVSDPAATGPDAAAGTLAVGAPEAADLPRLGAPKDLGW